MKLLLVDDEPIVLAGLQSILAEHADEFPIAGLCSCGEEALRAVERAQPDIVITDIRMPGMSGLDLAERIRALDERIVVILLTGYSDFTFAQKALSLGVFEYLVKPTRRTDILGCLRRAADRRGRLLAAARSIAPPCSADEHLSAFIRSALSAPAAPEAVRATERALMKDARAYYVCDTLFEAGGDLGAERDAFSLGQSVRGVFLNAFSGTAQLAFAPPGIGSLIAVAFTRQSGPEAAERVSRAAGACVREALRLLGAQLVIGLSGERSTLSELSAACAEAATARNSAAKSGHSFSSHASRQGMTHSPPIKKALRYIQAHFSDSISLKEVSAEVFLNAWYFSELFKKEVGKSFTDYILDLRIQLARQLIADRRLPLYQVSAMVGLNSPTYFSQVFKKATGLTPKEYRKQLAQQPQPAKK